MNVELWLKVHTLALAVIALALVALVVVALLALAYVPELLEAIESVERAVIAGTTLS